MRVNLFHVTTLFWMLVLLSEVPGMEIAPEYLSTEDKNIPEVVSYLADEEYIRQIHSMMDAFKGETMGRRFFIETNALIDTKYKTWKRNADLINSLLALPKGMYDAGRR